MASDPAQSFDPLQQFARMQSLWTNPLQTMFATMPTRYEAFDPLVQEIAVLATMHNMASMLQKPDGVKAALNAEIAERARKLAQRG